MVNDSLETPSQKFTYIANLLQQSYFQNKITMNLWFTVKKTETEEKNFNHPSIKM